MAIWQCFSWTGPGDIFHGHGQGDIFMDWALRKYRWWTGPVDNIHGHVEGDNFHGQGQEIHFNFMDMDREII